MVVYVEHVVVFGFDEEFCEDGSVFQLSRGLMGRRRRTRNLFRNEEDDNEGAPPSTELTSWSRVVVVSGSGYFLF